MKALLIVLFVSACACPSPPPRPAPPSIATTCPHGSAAPPLPAIVDVIRLRRNRDATAATLAMKDRELDACEARLRRAARVIRRLSGGR